MLPNNEISFALIVEQWHGLLKVAGLTEKAVRLWSAVTSHVTSHRFSLSCWIGLIPH